jgi:hypothetical protein
VPAKNVFAVATTKPLKKSVAGENDLKAGGAKNTSNQFS